MKTLTSRLKYRFWFPVILWTGLFLPDSLWPCSVPVFRYALERWPSDIFELAVFHEKPFTPEEETILDQLKQYAVNETTKSNYALSTIDVTNPEIQIPQTLLDERGQDPYPWAVVLTPLHYGRNRTIAWKGPLSSTIATEVVHSPIRQQIARRITDGQTAVWVFLECGDKEKDDKFAQTLQIQLDALNEALQIPELEEEEAYDPINQLYSGIELKIEFSMLRLSKENPEETVFIKMLLESESRSQRVPIGANDIPSVRTRPLTLCAGWRRNQRG